MIFKMAADEKELVFIEKLAFYSFREKYIHMNLRKKASDIKKTLFNTYCLVENNTRI